jgi:hypothetical protein
MPDDISNYPVLPRRLLGGFDLTDFARFLRETDPEWVNGTKKCFSASSIPKR